MSGRSRLPKHGIYREANILCLLSIECKFCLHLVRMDGIAVHLQLALRFLIPKLATAPFFNI